MCYNWGATSPAQGCLPHRTTGLGKKFPLYRTIIWWLLKHVKPIPVPIEDHPSFHLLTLTGRSALDPPGPRLLGSCACSHSAFIGPHVIGIIKTVVFSVWLLSLWILIMNFTATCIQDELMFLFQADWCLGHTMMFLSAVCVVGISVLSSFC